MMRALTTAATGMMAQQLNLDTIAHNLANVNTTGFKHQRAEFQDLIYQTYRASGAQGGSGISQPVSMQVGLGTQFSATASDFGVGAFQNTGNPLNVAIAGDGFFQVDLPNGTTAYTRDGSFKLDAEGSLVTSDGYKISGGITVPNGASQVTILGDGKVSAVLPGQNEPQDLGQIQVATFSNPAGLSRMGQNLYTSGGGSGEAKVVTPGDEGSGRLQAGMLEASNVQVVEEMVRMITAQRAYEINSKAIQTSDEMLSMLNQLKR